METWDTSVLPRPEQFSFWHDVICRAFVPLFPVAADPRGGFSSRVQVQPIVSLNRALIRSLPQETRHGPTEVAASSDAYYFVNLQLSGQCRVQHGGHESVVAPGQFVVLDTAAPYYLDFNDEWSMLSYRIPHSNLDERLAGRQSAIGRPFEGTGSGSAVVALTHALWNMQDPLPAASGRDLELSYAASVSAALLSLPFEPTTQAPTVNLLLIQRHVKDNLSDPNLSVATVSRAFHISPRSLHAAFESHDETFGSFVRRMRLNRAAELLSAPDRTATIMEVAIAVGYSDPSSFGRAFRRQWETPPHSFHRHYSGAEAGFPIRPKPETM